MDSGGDLFALERVVGLALFLHVLTDFALNLKSLVWCHHTFCCEPPLTEVPEGEWFCQDCMESRNLEAAANRPRAQRRTSSTDRRENAQIATAAAASTRSIEAETAANSTHVADSRGRSVSETVRQSLDGAREVTARRGRRRNAQQARATVAHRARQRR